MSRARQSILLWLAPFVVLVSAIGAKEEDAAPFFAKLQRGMTPEQVRGLVGAPQRLSRQILYHRYLEQWFYDAPVPVRLTFDCPRGHKPQLLSVYGLPVENGKRGPGEKRH